MNGASGKDIFAGVNSVVSRQTGLPDISMAPHKTSLHLLFSDFHWVESFASVKFWNSYVD